MLTSLLLLIVGLALLVKAGELFVAAAIRIAEFLRMPRVVIGSTLVSLATTTPELVVSLVAGAKGESGLALGNAVGSCICNIALILGVSAALKRVDVNLRSLRTPLAIMCGVGVLLLIMTLKLSLTHGQGWLLVAVGVAYFAFDFLRHARDRKPADVAEAGEIERDIVRRFAWFHSRTGTVVQFVAAAVGVVFGSRLLVDSAVYLASLLSIPPLVIGLTVVAVGTSLPELITAITSSRQNVSDLSVGNVLGANIANLTLIVGAAAVMSDVTFTRTSHAFNFAAMLGVFALLLWMLLTRSGISRRHGIVLLVTYAAYVGALVVMAVKE